MGNRYRDIDPMVGALSRRGSARTSGVMAFRPAGMTSRSAFAQASAIVTDLTSSNAQRRANARDQIRATSRAAKAGDAAAAAGLKIIKTANLAQKKKRKKFAGGGAGSGAKGERHRGYLVTHEGRILSGEFAKT